MNTFIEATTATFRAQKKLAEGALLQVPGDQYHHALDPHTNSLAVMMQHIGGNLTSRWTDFLTSDGEKPWRQRDEEFVEHRRTTEELFQSWEAGWEILFSSLGRITDADLSRTITIRGEVHTVPLAIQRSLAHTAYHVGQIVQLCRHLAGDTWDTLTLPRKPRAH